MEPPAHPRVPFPLVLTWVFSEAVMFRITPPWSQFFAAVHTKYRLAGFKACCEPRWCLWAEHFPSTYPRYPCICATFADWSTHSPGVCWVRVWLRALLSPLTKCPAGIYWPCNASYRHVLEINNFLLQYCVTPPPPPLLLCKCLRWKQMLLFASAYENALPLIFIANIQCIIEWIMCSFHLSHERLKQRQSATRCQCSFYCKTQEASSFLKYKYVLLFTAAVLLHFQWHWPGGVWKVGPSPTAGTGTGPEETQCGRPIPHQGPRQSYSK